MSSARRSALLVLAATAVALSLVGLVALDYRATRGELVGLLREQAHALRESVAAAARSNRAASAFAAAQLGERLLDRARALADLDRQGRLTPSAAREAGSRDPLLRIALFGPDGSREDLAAPVPDGEHGGRGPRAGWTRGGGPPGGGPGSGRGWGAGEGAGRGPGGGGRVVRQIFEEGRDEAVTSAHASRWGGERVAAGVKRARGGAIVVTVDATEIAALEKPASLESLLEEITTGSPEIAYTVFEHADGRIAFGDEPADAPASPGERSLAVKGRPVLEFASDVPLAGGETARLRLGMRLDNVRRVEERMLVRLVATVAAAGALVALAFGLAGLRRRYGVLSEKHARAEEALRRRDRLAAMGELASTVAHEVRNPLNAVGMTAQRLKREFLGATPAGAAEREELQDLLGIMTSETQRIDRIVQQFLEYARPPRLAPESVDLDALAGDVASRARSLAEARGVRVEVEASGAGIAVVDPAQLRQALDNLVRNAVEATPEGGRVSLSARREAGGHAVEVRDTGRGIEPDHLPRVFDLYFTTKADGTGVGLAVTQQIVTAHGGTIEVDSRPGGGTTMTVRLPAGEEKARG
ncbi:MAG TPA: ATP-binding protein [Vicinamibacteria bacterium]|nr:ATP-binding protein [Vicinamibacteria bacterium]